MAADLADVLAEIAAGKVAPLYLAVGDEFLIRQAADAIASALVPEKDRSLSVVRLEAAVGAREIAGEIGTMPMFRGRKVTVVDGAELLSSEKDAEAELTKARELWAAPGGKRRRDAALRLLATVRAAGWGAADLAFGAKTAPSAAKWRKEIGAAPDDGDKTWLAELSAFALEKKLAAPAAEVEVLVNAVARLPPTNVLVLTAEELLARDPLYRLAAEKGAVVACKVQRSGRDISTLDISAVVMSALGPLGKRLDRGAEQLLKERVGEHPRAMHQELAKLAAYSGDAKVITADDVAQLVERYQEAEFFALGNAVGDGDLGTALRLLTEELARARNPTSAALPFLGQVAGGVRRLLYDACRAETIPGASRDISYNAFQAKVWPEIEAECKEKGLKVPTPYGSYMSMQRARKRGRAALARALVACAKADAALKSGGDARLVLESLLVQVCRPSA